MKKKKETKKLIFNKISIAQLDNGKMNQAKGGETSQITQDAEFNSCLCTQGVSNVPLNCS